MVKALLFCLVELPSLSGDDSLLGASFRKADLRGADLRDAQNLTAEQILDAIIDDTTLLDPDVRAEYDRLKAAQQ